jgi:hypothetical protein
LRLVVVQAIRPSGSIPRGADATLVGVYLAEEGAKAACERLRILLGFDKSPDGFLLGV